MEFEPIGLVSPFIPLLLCLIDVHGNVHGEHSECESNTNQGEGTELCEAAYEQPRETEDNRPCDGDSDYIYDEGHTSPPIRKKSGHQVEGRIAQERLLS